MTRSGLRSRRYAAGLLSLLPALGSCASLTARRAAEAEPAPHRAGVLEIAWRSTVNDHPPSDPSPEECASGALAGGELVLGSRGAAVVGVAPETGHIDWVTSISGGVDGQARFDERRGQVYVGADDGSLYALDPRTGAVRWTYKGKGAIEQPAEVGGDLVYVASAVDRVVALEAATGKWRWQYERDMPEGFTIHGYAAPRLHANHVLAGFADGYFVALAAATGEVIWTRSLAAASDQFVDVDSTPAIVDDAAYVSSYSGGLYSVDLRDGTVKWRANIEGVGEMSIADRRLYFATPRQGLHAAESDGRVVWRQGLTDAGDVTRPQPVGPYLVFSASRAGLFVVDRATGSLLDVFNPGHGVCASATVDPSGRRLYVLSNGGDLYALNLR